MKRCGTCGLTKPLDEFRFRSKNCETRRSFCRACQRRYSRAWYDRTDKSALNDRVRELVRGYRSRNRKFAYSYLATHPCVDCGINDPVVLEFDHVRGQKVAAISVLIREAVPLQRIEAEIAKCVVRCANCHRGRPTRQLRWKSVLLVEGSAFGGG